jgi:acetylornithine deacetylase/succinyl-diaminopimelate desuccinylase-like protein
MEKPREIFLGASSKPIYPSEVRDRIKALGFPDQKNLLASVLTVLKRLAEAGQIKEVAGA